jgi:hypothetical protein
LVLVLLGVLVLLCVGAIVLSLETAPPVAQQQVQLAARNTAAASSFVLTDVNTVKASRPSSALGGRASETTVVRITFQAPDRVLDEVYQPGQPTAALVVIGDRRFERRGTGSWTELPPASSPAGASTGELVARELVVPLESLFGASSVVRVFDTTYLVEPSEREQLLGSLFGQEASTLSKLTTSATVKGEFVTAQFVTARRGSFRFAVDLGYSSINEAPPIEEPVTSNSAP